MNELYNHAAVPAVSIILPTYNRAAFLPAAFEAIRNQAFMDWELIVVDDGSTDDTRDVLPSLTEGWTQSIRCVRQDNQGPYPARNAGLDLARGTYIAFFDSDDLWLPHHLESCVEALRATSDVDWVYGACRIVDFSTNKILAPNTFYVDGEPRPFLSLRTRIDGTLRVIDDLGATARALLTGLYAGLQNSVIRRQVFDGYRFEGYRRDEAEDQYLVVRALKSGRRLAYFDDVHVIYHVHEQNSSATGGQSLEKHIRIFRTLIEGYEALGDQVPLNSVERQALNRRLSREYFWHLGYTLFQSSDRKAEALSYMRHGLWLWPTNLALWKSYLASWFRTTLGVRPHSPASHPEVQNP